MFQEMVILNFFFSITKPLYRIQAFGKYHFLLLVVELLQQLYRLSFQQLDGMKYEVFSQEFIKILLLKRESKLNKMILNFLWLKRRVLLWAYFWRVFSDLFSKKFHCCFAHAAFWDTKEIKSELYGVFKFNYFIIWK